MESALLLEVAKRTGVTSFCPNCGAAKLQEFYRCSQVPVHSVLVYTSREEAVDSPKGDVALACCSACSFITNTAFDPALERYGAGYESTQSYSPTFNKFHHDLAKSLIKRYDLRGKDVLEIGCGQGEFLELLCELGDNRGVGFDPAFVESRSPLKQRDRVTIVADFYSEKYSAYEADFVCCKQTLEHIPDTARFVGTVRRAIGDRHDTRVFFQVPDVTRILEEAAFWDIYYEHCSYFCPDSLRMVFERSGFDVLESRTEYDGQYLMIEARPGTSAPLAESSSGGVLSSEVQHFGTKCRRAVEDWRGALGEIQATGRRVVLWGGGSKAVAFLTTLGVQREINYVVDINPRKWDTFLPGSGHRVVGPEFMVSYQPDIIIIMNPIYTEEIGRSLNGMGIGCHVVPIIVKPRRCLAPAAV